MVPLVQGRAWPAFDTDNLDDNSVVWSSTPLCANLYACLSRRCLDACSALPTAFCQSPNADLHLETAGRGRSSPSPSTLASGSVGL
jgi:hypothetical protein